MRVRWTPTALDALAAIEDYIALDNPAAAARWVDGLVARAEHLASFPHLGRRVPEFPNLEMREVVHANYRIAYRVTPDAIEVITVFEGHHLPPADILSGVADDEGG